ncbi:YihY/virulence factor BrkB family protein [Aureibacter tunicatorum]|uniref:Membrane protein n=1 Tax=Aureibacter tunicatorum TaxID=866807 RepID=A0AAE3XK88_9BACT|nr:YihY/virulence factor BrkB family protein [Aureibacter tunicatorum]MDR6238055.1 membrane protein [Aureibacter tunicatorum]BDD03088.1 hypothetical protein AUTU_05710 [Aureibacter tunicatorum]
MKLIKAYDQLLEWIRQFNVNDFFRRRMWMIDKSQMSWSHRFGIDSLQVLWIAIKSYIDDRSDLKASGLTYYTLLSIVPLFSLAFAIAKGFGYDQLLEKEIMIYFSGHEEIAIQVVAFARKMLDNTKGGPLAIFGAVVLLYSTMRLLYNIEETFADIWDLKKSRPLGRRFSDYMTILMIAPLLMILSGSITIYITSQIERVSSEHEWISYASPFLLFLIRLVPYAIVWMAFIVLYIIMPYTKVRLKPALIAGIVAGTMYQLVQWGLITFQVGVSRYNAIYGSFAALPLFLIWLQISWSIFMIGGQISYAVQNLKNFSFTKGKLDVSHNERHLLALLVMKDIVDCFKQGKHDAVVKSISQRLTIPMYYVFMTIEVLKKANLVHEVDDLGGKGNKGFVPAISTDKISVFYILEQMDKKGKDHISFPDTEEIKDMKDRMESIYQAMQNSKGNVTLRDL